MKTFVERPTHWSEILCLMHMDSWFRFKDGGFVKNYETFEVTDPSINKPTEDELNKKLTEVQTEWDTNQYQRDRQYPSIGDQLDMQYHDELDGTTTWKDAIAKVKADNPKE